MIDGDVEPPIAEPDTYPGALVWTPYFGMETVRGATEADVVGAFLRAEIDSDRWDNTLGAMMADFDLRPEELRSPDLTDGTANRKRAALLGRFRGWNRNTYLFLGFPKHVEWALMRLDRSDFKRVRYANSPEWRDLSRKTWQPLKGANRIKGGDRTVPAAIPVANINAIASELRSGRSNFAPLIGARASGGELIVLLEGHSRFTACCMVKRCESVDMFVGTADPTALRIWHWLPPLFDESGRR